MKARSLFLLSCCAVVEVFAQETPLVDLPSLSVYSDRVAVQNPAGTFPMPISSLRFEPLVDVQSRNLAEGQSDVAIRGGTFENTGFKVGAISLYDPETGHFFPEIPIAPAMLTQPSVLTGVDNAWRGWNANAGTVSYGWRPIRNGGFAASSYGQYDTFSGELYDGHVTQARLAGAQLAFDSDVAYSRSNGSRPWGEQEFFRADARLQLRSESAQTDLFYGYQTKAFGWPNLYTPFAKVFETEDTQTNLLMVNHRISLGGEDYINAGAYYRQNHDHYVFDRPEVGAYNPAFATGPAFHKTWVYGAGVEGSVSAADTRWNFSSMVLSDELKSSSLIFGPYRTRDHLKLSFVPEKSWKQNDGSELDVKIGATYDDTNRNSSAVSPVAEVALDHLNTSAGLMRIYTSFARTTQTPTYFALDSNPTRGLFRGNPRLDRESSDNFEIGGSLNSGAWTQTAAVFYRRDRHLVDWTYSTAATNSRSANPVNIDVAGFELVSRYATKSWDLVFGYSAMHKNADYGPANVDASFYALNYPLQRATLALTVRAGSSWEFRLDNEFRIQETNRLRRSTRRPLISTIGAFYTVHSIPGLKLSAEIENLWNSDYEEVPAVPAARRQATAGATYSW